MIASAKAVTLRFLHTSAGKYCPGAPDDPFTFLRPRLYLDFIVPTRFRPRAVVLCGQSSVYRPLNLPGLRFSLKARAAS